MELEYRRLWAGKAFEIDQRGNRFYPVISQMQITSFTGLLFRSNQLTGITAENFFSDSSQEKLRSAIQARIEPEKEKARITASKTHDEKFKIKQSDKPKRTVILIGEALLKASEEGFDLNPQKPKPAKKVRKKQKAPKKEKAPHLQAETKKFSRNEQTPKREEKQNAPIVSSEKLFDEWNKRAFERYKTKTDREPTQAVITLFKLHFRVASGFRFNAETIENIGIAKFVNALDVAAQKIDTDYFTEDVLTLTECLKETASNLTQTPQSRSGRGPG